MATELPITFMRGSLADLLEELEARGPKSIGVVALIMDKDGKGSFRISGFDGPMDRFVVAGMMDWVKADLMSDYVR